GPSTAGDSLIEDRPALHLLHILTEVANGQLFRNRDIALIGCFLANHHAEQSRLAGAIGTDQADLLAGVQLKGSVHEDQLLAVLLVDVRKRDHRNTKLAEPAAAPRGKLWPCSNPASLRGAA